VSKLSKNKKKGARFFTLKNRALMISTVFLIIAVSIAYPTYIDNKVNEEIAQQILKDFDKSVFELEVLTLQSISDNSEPTNTMDSLERMSTNEEEINVDYEQRVPYKPSEGSKLEYETIAKLQIDKIGLKTPVLSEWSYELLEISVNKFSGPDPNELGNFVVIGHNYKGGVHFGNVHLLEIGDLIVLTDLSGREITYEIYEIIIIQPEEIDKLTTYETRTLTLVTCDSSSELRIVIKSRDRNQ